MPSLSSLTNTRVVIGLTLMALFVSTTPTLASISALDTLDRVRIFDPPRAIHDAELIDYTGKPFSLGELNGRVALIFFGFTHCPDVCPLAMLRLQQLEKSGEFESSEIAYVMVGIDPERDTPAAMQDFLENFSSEFIGLSGDKRLLKTVTKNFSASFFKGTSNDDDYNVSHSPQIFALDPQGQLRAELYDAPVDTIATVVRALLDE